MLPLKFIPSETNMFQYHSGRLYTVGPGGLSVVELSKKSVMAVKVTQLIDQKLFLILKQRF